jgi:photosystem II stability/assembly factor-like uncharacterized protein
MRPSFRSAGTAGRTPIVVLAALVVLPCLSVRAQQPPSSDSALARALGQVEWRPLGPANMGGRVTDIVGVPGDPRVFYLGGADGGVFRTRNAGTTFDELFTDQRVYSVGALAVAPSDASVVWVGTGEGDPRNSVSYGDGVYRSLDGGDTWTHLGLDGTERIKRVRVHPADPDVAWVCALGREWGPNPERGVFRTEDGGRTWEKVLFVDDDTGCSDLDLELSNPRILYAGMWTFRRRPWRFDDGGRATALWRSRDGGDTWEELNDRPGMPAEPLARIGVAVAQSDPRTVYLISETKTQGQLWRSDDRGESWRTVSHDRAINFRPFYYADLRVDPTNPEVVLALSGGLFKSTDGGRTFERIAQDVHGDHQAFWIDPEDPRRYLSGSDGGFQVSMDAGVTFDILNNVTLSQFYQIDVDDRDPYWVCGGLQDNGNWCGPSHSLHARGILKDDWFTLSGGDGFYSQSVPGMPWLVFTNSQGGNIALVDTRTGAARRIHPYPKIVGSAGDAMVEHRYRFNWDAPIHISPHDPGTVYFGGNVLFRSTDFGQSWEEISPDLTTDDPDKQLDSGGEIYLDNTAAEFHTTLLTVEESPVEAGVIWTGSDDGLVHVTRDAGASWSDVTGAARSAGLPEEAWIAKVEASRHARGRAYLAVDQHRMDDFRPLVFVTDDYGATWRSLAAGLPQDDFVRVVREDPTDPEILYAGMERGLQVSFDRGRAWHDLRGTNLPPVSVHDIQIQREYNDLVIGTHGRGVYVLDDLTPVQQLAHAMRDAPYLFPVRRATRWEVTGRDANQGQRGYAAPNPPDGAQVSFYLGEKPEEDLSIEIRGADGEALRTLAVEEPRAGLNLVIWDLREDGTPGAGGGGGFFGGSGGPRVVPGTYTVALLGEGWERTATVEVRGDPRVDMEPTDYRAQHEALVALRELSERVEGAVDVTESLDEQLGALQATLRDQPGAVPDVDVLRPEVERARAEVDSTASEHLRRPPPTMNYRQRPRVREEIRSLMRAIDGVEAPPTDPQLLRVRELHAEAQEAIDAIWHVWDTTLRGLNERLGPEGPTIVIDESLLRVRLVS